MPARHAAVARVFRHDAVVVRLRKLDAWTERTTTDGERLRAALDETRQRGWALVDQELEIGLRSIAVPVADSTGRVAAALNVGAQAARVTIGGMERRFLPLLRAAARDVGMLLG